jgi:hypothetical protein
LLLDVLFSTSSSLETEKFEDEEDERENTLRRRGVL